VSFMNGEDGLTFRDGGDSIAVKQTVYLNGGAAVVPASTVTVVESALGYDASGASQPDSNHEVNFGVWATVAQLRLMGCRLNPLLGAVFNNADGTGLISFNQDFATGTVKVSQYPALDPGEALTLDHAQPTWHAWATAPLLMRGAGHAASVSSAD